MGNGRKYIFTFLDRDEDGLFKDMAEHGDVVEFWPSHKEGTRLNKPFKKMLMNYRMAKLGGWMFYNIHKYPFCKDVSYSLIIPTSSIGKLSVRYLKRLKKKHPNIRLFALVTDSMHADSPHMDYVRQKLFSDVWDAVLTYDRYDAKEYGFQWFGYCYYSFHGASRVPKKSDLYYVGVDKGNRREKVESVYGYLKDNGVKCRFDVVCPRAKQDQEESGIKYRNRKISYRQVLERVQSANCILEVLQEGQETQSIRYFEAVVYNKKLLTTNRHLSELPFYDGRYMKYFEKPEDIDSAWVKKVEKIDYGYKNEFSPLYLVDYIKENF